MITKLFLIALGGSLGAPLRYLINHSMKDFYFFMLPSGIMLVNFIGCFFIGIAMAYISDFKSNAYYLLIVGFLGSFTTMSAFSMQTIDLFNSNALSAITYVILTFSFTIIATYIGLTIFSK